MDHSLLTAFLLGVSIVLHCVGMCGGIMGAMTLGLKREIRDNHWKLAAYVSAYNMGRIGSYVLAGALIGTLGEKIFYMISPEYGHAILKAAASLIIIGIGFYQAGWFPDFAAMEKIGAPLWSLMEPYGRRLIPPRTPLHALLFGAVWGWLPCGMVYSTLILTASAGNAMDGGMFMLAFGLGTLPGMVTTGIIAGLMVRLTRLPYVKQAVGLLIILLGMASLLYTRGTAYEFLR